MARFMRNNPAQVQVRLFSILLLAARKVVVARKIISHRRKKRIKQWRPFVDAIEPVPAHVGIPGCFYCIAVVNELNKYDVTKRIR